MTVTVCEDNGVSDKPLPATAFEVKPTGTLTTLWPGVLSLMLTLRLSDSPGPSVTFQLPELTAKDSEYGLTGAKF